MFALNLYRPEIQASSIDEISELFLNDDSVVAKLHALTDQEKHELLCKLTSRNGSIVEYNDVLSVLLGCNVSVSPLGAISDANSAIF
jgi:hypothetical protein